MFYSKKILRYIFSFLFVIRVAFGFYLKDLHSEDYFEFGDIARNLMNGKGFSYFYVENGNLMCNYKDTSKPYPSAWMPPGYVFFIGAMLIIKDVVMRNVLILLIQSVIGTLSLYYLYKFSLNIFSHRIAIIAVLIGGLLPDIIYSALSYGPTVFYHLAIMLFFYKVYSRELVDNKKSGFQITMIILSLLLLRAEMLLFIFIVLMYFICKKRKIISKYLFFGTLFLLSTWSLRNYSVFGEFSPTVTSGGFNLYRGHNEMGIGNWGNRVLYNSLNSYTERDFEVKFNQLYSRQAVNFARRNLDLECSNSIKKLFYLMIYNPEDSRGNNIFILLTWWIVFLLIIMGIWGNFSFRKYGLIYLLFTLQCITIVVFFPMLRYQTLIKFPLIPFAAFTVEYLFGIHYRKNGRL